MNSNATTDKKILSKPARAAFSVLFCVVLAAICVGVTYFGMPAVTVLPLVVVYISCGSWAWLLMSLIYMGGSAALYWFGISPDWYTLVETACFILTGCFTALALKKQLPYRRVIVGLAVVMSLSMFVRGILPALLDGVPAFTYLQTMLDDATVEAGLTPSLAPSAEMFLPYSILLGMIASGGVVLLIRLAVRMLGKALNENAPELKPMAPMHLWSLSRGFKVGLLVSVIAGVIIYFTDVKNADAVILTLLVITGVPLMMQGFCFVMYSRRMGCLMSFGSWVIWAVLVFMFPYSIYVLMALGLLDQFSRVRSRFPDGMPPPPKPPTME